MRTHTHARTISSELLQRLVRLRLSWCGCSWRRGRALVRREQRSDDQIRHQQTGCNPHECNGLHDTRCCRTRLWYDTNRRAACSDTKTTEAVAQSTVHRCSGQWSRAYAWRQGEWTRVVLRARRDWRGIWCGPLNPALASLSPAADTRGVVHSRCTVVQVAFAPSSSCCRLYLACTSAGRRWVCPRVASGAAERA